MGESTLLQLFLAFQVFSISFVIVNGSKFSERGLSIKLIHRDSPESPLYRPDLTETQRTEDLILQSTARSVYLLGYHGVFNTTRDFDTNRLRARVYRQSNSVFMAQVGIGTFGSSTIPYFLHMDTGSSLIWMQCEGCRTAGRHCFHQNQPIFPDSRSRTYHKLPCNRHPLCFPGQCLQNFCTYQAGYHFNSTSQGFLATERFVFNAASPPAGWDVVTGIVFGCGFNQQNMPFTGADNNIAGMMGLGWGPRSLPAQLGARGQLRFSYCLPSTNSNVTAGSHLLFGSEIPTPPELTTTDLVQVNSFEPYFVNMVGISIANQRVQIPSYFFVRRGHNHQSGTVIDAGSSYTSIVQPAYDILEETMMHYLLARVPGLTRVHIPNFFKLCFQRPSSGMREGYSDLPSMTFHFKGDADMVMQPEVMFSVGGVQREPFCMALLSAPYDVSSGGLTLIGANQQINQRVIFDVGHQKLHFCPQNCARNG